MKQIRIIARILVGLVFIFSGFVKGVDPMGSAIKFTEYFEVFHLNWLEHYAIYLSILLSTAEFLIGISLVIGLRIRLTSWAALVFMVFFTALTLYSAIFSPVSDCGCFGDALVITNWQTFYKNVVLLALAIFIFKNRFDYMPYGSCFKEWLLVGFFAASMTSISVYAFQHQPLLDFRPYHVGSNIPSKMEIPVGAPTHEFKTTLYYSKNGEIKEFTLDNFPANDTTWKWVRTDNKIIKEGYIPPIKSFSIVQEDGVELSQQILGDQNYSFLFLSPDLQKLTNGNWNKIADYKKYVDSIGANFYFVTGSPTNITSSLKQQLNLNYDFVLADVTMLKTINRSNPGLMILKEGTILAQINVNDLPNPKELKGTVLSTLVTGYYKQGEHLLVYLLLALLGLSIALVWGFKSK